MKPWHLIKTGLAGTSIIFLFAACSVSFDAGILAAADDEDERDSETAEYEAEQAEVEAEIKALGLDKRYKTIPLHDDTYHVLYHLKDFKTVEERLAAELAGSTTPLASYRYHLHTETLSDSFYDEDLAEYLAVLDKWVAEEPDSHFARMIRGKLLKEYGWYYRGDGFSDEVTRDGWVKFADCLERAKQDLEAAHAMNPGDPEASCAMIGVAAGLGMSDKAAERYYQQAISARPFHYGARSEKLFYSLPRWGGSWEKIDAIMKECESASADFPMLLLLNEEALDYMEDRGQKYVDAATSTSTLEKWKEACIAQVEQTPGDLHVFGDVAAYAVLAGDYKTATEYFRKIGDQFPVGCRYVDLPDYNKWRAISYAVFSADDKIRKTDQETALIGEALELAPNNGYVHYIGSEYFISRKEYDSARIHIEKARVLAPDYMPIMLTLGWLNYHQRRLGDAIDTANEFLKTNPSEDEKAQALEIIELSEKRMKKAEE